MADELEIRTVPAIPLTRIAEDQRWRYLDRLEAYYRGQQDAGKPYDWNGYMVAVDGASPVKPGWVVPYSQRRPSARFDIGKVIIRRLTAMALGSGRFPTVTVAGDEDAEDFARELVKVSKMPVRMIEARNLGGATGTAVLSWGLRRGRPSIRVHKAQHVTVLSWEDVDEHRPAVVLKAWSYTRPVINRESQKVEQKKFWAARLWDETSETRWRDIPDEIARQPNWFVAHPPIERITHDFGFCPVYWIQNVSDSEGYDGESDIDGLQTSMDELNQLRSATTKGTKANVDPTLVIKQSPMLNQGQVYKGSENAIYSEGGAEYLELKGTAVQAAKEEGREVAANIYAVAGVVDPDAEKLSGAAQSAQAMRILYAPMLDRADMIRTQYGDGIVQMLRDMLEIAQRGALETLEDEETGERVELGITLPPRFERDGDGDDAPMKAVERKPGTSTEVDLQWPPYFSPTWDDMNKASTAVKTATGGKPVLSQKTAIRTMARVFDIEDPDLEIEQIEEESEKAMEKMKDAMGPIGGAPGGSLLDGPPGAPKPPKPPKPGTAKKPDNGEG